ncbi:hypothetical protein [Croceitalea rosinachiae]|uniref:Uncharacterized protein n=1 Tax=Croceitalea rosinachiae TaxID=3075596 RepID=A0ABU3A836_9FLAO|nr:hypothetical protein [Croceitalea sp. F388]MDT0605960.1 hypothetical protein [Croceitalea sp. F388]
MSKLIFIAFLVFELSSLIAQTDKPKFCLGASYGTSFSLGDFKTPI